MNRSLVKGTIAAMLLGLGMAFGMALEHVRAQPKVTLADARITHIGLGVKDVDKVIDLYSGQLQTRHAPVHEIKQLNNKPFAFPDGSNADRNAFVRTSEIQLNGFEIHLMQGVGGASPWRDHLEKHGEGSLEHIAFASKDVKGVADQLVAKGGRILVGKPESGFVYIQMPNLPFMIEMYTDR